MTCYECFSDWLTADDKTCTVVETVVGDFSIKKKHMWQTMVKCYN